MATKVFQSGTFKGVDIHNAFAVAALNEAPVVFDLGPIAWPAGLAPTSVPLGNYAPGSKITGALRAKADVLIVLYTEQETSALLEVFTGNKDWTPQRREQWCGYAHNFDQFKDSISGIGDDVGLKQGIFGYLAAFEIGSKAVVLYKTELHPKQNGNKLPFVPVLQQLITELAPGMVISTGTAGGIGSTINCGDVAITDMARLHCQKQYPGYPEIDTLSTNGAALTNNVPLNTQYVTYAATNFTKLSLDGLSQCYARLQQGSGSEYAFVKKNVSPPAIYVSGTNPVPGPQPMAIVSADYLTVDDSNDSEGLQPLGIMNDTDDAFLFYAISTLPGNKPKWLSVRNASEPQIVHDPFPPGTPMSKKIHALGGIAGTIYGIYQYCTTLNSAFACWGIVAGL